MSQAKHTTSAHAADQPTGPALPAGARLPAEWEPQSCVWLVPPHNPQTWPGCFDRAAAQFDAFMTELARATPISTPAELGVATNDSWIRDFGPITTLDPLGQPLFHDFIFNGWGGKYESRDLDDAVPTQLASALGLPVAHHSFVLEGGSIAPNGRGTALTTEQCLLHPNRPRTHKPPGQTARAYIEQTLHDTLGITHLIWLPGGIEGDDTDGHIDDVARFLDPHTIACISAPPGHPDHATTAANLEALRDAHDPAGRPFDVIELPMPDPILYDFPPDRFGPGGTEPVPASYANFLISNGHVFVPVFGQPTDDQALRLLDDAMPGHRVVPVRAEWLVVGLGALHCLSMQQPAAPG